IRLLRPPLPTDGGPACRRSGQGLRLSHTDHRRQRCPGRLRGDQGGRGARRGAFKITKGCLEKFGEERVIDTPLAESGFVGAAIGAALMGMRPVVEMQFADFISCAFDQIVNMAAKHHYRLREPVPMVIRAPYGGRLHAGPFHSQCPEAWFVHSPRLQVVAPSTPSDAKGLLKASIRDPNPAIYCE